MFIYSSNEMMSKHWEPSDEIIYKQFTQVLFLKL